MIRRLLIVIILLNAAMLFAQDSLNIRRLQRLYIANLPLCAIEAEGSYAFVESYRHGLHIYNIEIINDVIHWGATPSPGIISDIVIRDTLAFACSSTGLLIYNMANPSSPQLISSLNTPDGIRILYYFGYLYIVATSALYVVDVSRIEEPVLVEELGFYDILHDADIFNEFVFVTSMGSMQIFDISAPWVLRLVSNVDLEGTLSRILVYDQYAYVAIRNSGLHIFDISVPVSPHEVARFDSTLNILDMDIKGTYLYLAADHDGIQVLDIYEPTFPRLVGYYSSGPGISDVAALTGGAMVIEGEYFTIYDVSAALSSPEHHTAIPTQFSLHTIYPNPFNNTANIAFDLPREVTGRLVVYDVLGRTMSTLHDGKFTAGTHAMQFSGNNLSSGTYFIRLESPAFTATQKAVLLK